MVRLMQSIEEYLQHHLTKSMLSSSSNINLYKNEIENIVFLKTGHKPDITIEYDRKITTFIIKMEYIGLKINIINGEYELDK